MNTTYFTIDDVHRYIKLQKNIFSNLQIFKLNVIRNAETEFGNIILREILHIIA